ncbi:MAG TPA: TonB-dependent receptor [Bryobacterales bacterium]|nr:TonB-dependent receptor [Bryobacterales bacterium]
MYRRIIVLAAAFTFSLLLPRPSAAQVLYGSIVGAVTDPSGAVVPGAHVTVLDSATGESREAVTDTAGRYSIANLPTATYEVKVTATGFRPFSRTSVAASINTVTRVNVQLEVGAETQEVTVSSAAAILETDKSDVHTELNPKEMSNLPLPNYRNYQSLLNLVPGATPTAFQNSVTDTPQRALTTNVNGTNRNNNNTRVDGAGDVFVWLPHHTVYVPPEETIDVVNITTDSFDAEQGMAGGAAVTVTTKSGTNQLHGVAFAYWDDNKLQARNFFYYGAKTPFSLHNIDGGTLGGPIVKNKLFFFGSWEGTWERQNYSSLFTVPTAPQRAGDFSSFGTNIYDPTTGDASGKGRTAFAGNMIPASRQSPIALKLQDLIPAPNLGGSVSNYFNSGLQALNRNNFDAKVDWNRTANHHLFFKYSIMLALVNCDFGLGAAGGPGLCNGGPGTAPTRVQMPTIGHSIVLSPNLLLDQVFGFTRMGQHGTDSFYGQNIGLNLGIPGTNGPDIRQSGFPIFNITGYTSLGQTANWMPFWRNDQSWTTSHNLTWNHGSHEFRFGFDMIHYQLNQWQPEAGSDGPRGLITIDGATTGLNGGPSPNQFNAWAATLLGLDSSVGKSLQYFPLTGREWQFGWYARDRWQATRNLTLNLGLRYEFYPLVHRATSGLGRYDLATNQIVIGGLGGNPENAGITVSHRMFAPRLGLAYRLGKGTVIRAGYGISYDPLPMSRVFRDPFPLTVVQEYPGPNSFVGYGTLAQGIPLFTGPDLRTGSAPVPPVALISRSPFAGELHRGYIQSWNFVVERQLPGSFVASLGYVGTATTHQFVDHELNVAPPGGGTAGRALYAPFGRTAGTLMEDGWLSSNYHSLQVTINRRLTNGLLVKGAYTHSKAIDWADDDGRTGLTWNYAPVLYRNRALSGFDVPDNFEVGWVYEAPFGKGKMFAQRGPAAWILGNWQLNGTFSAYSGTPFTVSASGASLNAPGNSQTADQVLPGVKKLNGIGPNTPYYDPLAFRSVTGVRFGDTGRNILRGPGVVNTNLSLFRSFAISERFALQFRAESYNFTNTGHFNNPSTNVSNMRLNADGSIASLGNFMSITSAQTDQRQFRLGLRLSF